MTAQSLRKLPSILLEASSCRPQPVPARPRVLLQLGSAHLLASPGLQQGCPEATERVTPLARGSEDSVGLLLRTNLRPAQQAPRPGRQIHAGLRSIAGQSCISCSDQNQVWLEVDKLQWHSATLTERICFRKVESACGTTTSHLAQHVVVPAGQQQTRACTGSTQQRFSTPLAEHSRKPPGGACSSLQLRMACSALHQTVGHAVLHPSLPHTPAPALTVSPA